MCKEPCLQQIICKLRMTSKSISRISFSCSEKSQLLRLEIFWKIIHLLISHLKGGQNLDCIWSHSVQPVFLSRDHLFIEIYHVSQCLTEIFSIFFSINTRAEQSFNLWDCKWPYSTATVIKLTSRAITHTKSLLYRLVYSHIAILSQTKINYSLRSADLSLPQKSLQPEWFWADMKHLAK